MSNFKILQGATPKTGEPLCKTCKKASVVRGQNMEEFILCKGDEFDWNKGIVKFKVAECGSYHPSNVPWLWEMEDMAWIVEARKRGPAGFTGGLTEPQMDVIIRRPGEKEDTPTKGE